VIVVNQICQHVAHQHVDIFSDSSDSLWSVGNSKRISTCVRSTALRFYSAVDLRRQFKHNFPEQ